MAVMTFEEWKAAGAPSPEKKGGGLLSALLPTVGGTLGAVGGTLLGGPAGTFAGGAAGSGLGEFLRQQLTGEEANLGTVGREALLGAVPGGFGLAAKGIRGAKTAAKGVDTAADATQAAPKTVSASAQADLDIPAFLRQGKSLDTSPIAGADRGAILEEAAEAQRFNDLARQNIQRLAQERATQGVPMPGGGVLVRPGAAPSFASEGVELKPVPKVPDLPTPTPSRTPKATSETPTATDTYGVPLPEATGTTKSATNFMDTRQPTTSPSMFQRLGQKATKAGSGIKVGAGVGDINKADEQARFLAEKGFTGTPEKQLRAMSEEMGSLSKQVDDVLSSKPIPVSGSKVSQDIYKASTDPNVFPDLDVSAPSVQRIMQANATKIQNITGAKDLNDYVKTINKAATQARAKLDDPKARALSSAETAALATKRVVDEQLKQIPDIAPQKQQMAQIFEINPQVAKAAEKSFTLPFLGVSMKTPMQMAKGAQSKLGAMAQGASQPGTGGGFRPFVKPALQQAGARVASSAVLGTPFVGSPEAPQQSEQLTPDVDASMQDALNQTPQQPSQSQQLFDDALRHLQETGDIKGTQTIAALAQQAAEMEKLSGSGRGKPLSAEASKLVANAESGLTSLQQLQGMLQQDPSIQGKSAVSSTFDPFGATSAALGTSSYENAKSNIADVITRLRTGAALTESEEAFYKKQLPQPFDPPQTVQQKLAMFNDLFQRVAGTGRTTTDVDPSQALSGAY